ncbi:MAG: hypothetical protein K8T25_18505 [Planctomycetia bacterium]|nr:hypothetical protein [Planctomycetia bacterium]
MKEGKNPLHLIGSVLMLFSVTLIPGIAVAAYLGAVAAFTTTFLAVGIAAYFCRSHLRLLWEGSGRPVPLLFIGAAFISGAIVILNPHLFADRVSVTLPDSRFGASASFLQAWAAAILFMMGLGIFIHGVGCLWEKS